MSGAAVAVVDRTGEREREPRTRVEAALVGRKGAGEGGGLNPENAIIGKKRRVSDRSLRI